LEKLVDPAGRELLLVEEVPGWLVADVDEPAGDAGLPVADDDPVALAPAGFPAAEDPAEVDDEEE
jgi:hypothetical protein